MYLETMILLLVVPGVANQRTSGGANVKVTTLNTFLFPVEDSDTRAQLLVNQIRASDTDLFCFQEISSEYQIRNIVEATRDVYPYSWSFIHDTSEKLNEDLASEKSCCPDDILLTIAQCYITHCRNVTASYDAITHCTLENCNPSLHFGYSACLECMLPCDNGIANHVQRVSCGLQYPFTKPCMTRRDHYLPPPTFGMLMLSRRPLSNVERHSLFELPSLLPRGAIAAKAEGIGTVICSYHSRNIGGPFLDAHTGFESYADQNLDHMRRVVSRYRTRPGLIMMGDFNAGPGNPNRNIPAEHIDSYDYARSQGFISVNVRSGLGCTYCRDNPLALRWGSYPPDARGLILDHIFLHSRNISRLVDTKLWMKCQQDDGLCIPLSDHYGVTAELTAWTQD